MTINDKIRSEKLQYSINREEGKYQCYHLEKLINMNILQVKYYYYCPLIKKKIIEQAKFTYSPLGNDFDKQAKTIEDQGIKQHNPNLGGPFRGLF